MPLSRRHLLAGAAAAAAGAAMPAAAVAKAAPATHEFPIPDWQPRTHYQFGSVARIGNRSYFCVRAHLSGDKPERCWPFRIQISDGDQAYWESA